MTNQITDDTVRFFKDVKPFKGFYSTWLTVVLYEHKVAIQIINQFKKHPYMTNIQYHKRKKWGVNSISVSFKTAEDEAAFLLYSVSGIPVKYNND
jgi:hypothetical protein